MNLFKIILLVASLFLVGCGQSGALYLPKNYDHSAATQTSSPSDSNDHTN